MILLLMKSKIAYDHLRNKFSEYEFAPFIPDERSFLKTMMSMGDYIEIAVLDEQISFFEEAERILSKRNLVLLPFHGDFSSVENQIRLIYQSSSMSDEENEENIERNDIEEKKEESESSEPPEIQREYDFSTPKKEVVIRQQIRQKSLSKDGNNPKNIVESDYSKSKKKVTKDKNSKVQFHVLPSKMILIGSLYPGAGSTFVAMNLARMLADNDIPVTYVENPMNPKAYAYDALYIDGRMETAHYRDWAEQLVEENQVKMDTDFLHKGVRWIVKDPRILNYRNWNYELMMRFVYSVRRRPIVIWDVSTSWNLESVKNIIPQCDEIFLVIDPDPVRLDWASIPNSRESQILNLIRSYESYIPVHTIANKNNEGVDFSTWKETFPFESAFPFPLIDVSLVHQAMWKGELVYDIKGAQQAILEACLPISKTILPEIVWKEKKNKNILSRIWRR